VGVKLSGVGVVAVVLPLDDDYYYKMTSNVQWQGHNSSPDISVDS